jgi:uncharacterized SAM-binding protein YcdF (DUF218 family)
VPLLLLLRFVRRLVALLLLAVVLVVGGSAARVWWVARQDDRRPSDVIAVLGASQFNGRPSSVLEARLEHAKTLYDAGVAPDVVTLGGAAPGDRFTEAAAGRTYLAGRGVPDVVALGEGRDTLQSIRALKAAMAPRGWRTVVLVTDPWHTLRARRMASDLGIDVVASPTRRGPSVRTRSTEARYIARETAAYLYYRVFGSSSEKGPRAV